MSSITNIQASDLITDSRADLNNNFENLNNDKIETSTLDTDTTLAADSDDKIATQKAVKAYVDTGGNVNATETTKGIVEIATQAEVDAGTDTGATGATVVLKPSHLAGRASQQITYAEADSPATWTKGPNLKRIRVQAWGGGASGGARNDNAATGGGGGGYFEAIFEAGVLGATETAIIGAGGAGVTTGTFSDGNAGNNTTFGSLLTAYAGEAGTQNIGDGPGGDGADIQPGSTLFRGAGTTGAGGIGIFWGGAGGGGSSSGSAKVGGNSLWGGAGGGAADITAVAGGTSLYGGNGGAGNTAGAGVAGAVPSGGGGGSQAGESGAGGDGQIIVTEYYV